MKNPGKLVQTRDGSLGRTYNKEGLVNGKVMVHLLDKEKFQPKKDSSGNPIKLLCDPSTLTIKGFID